MTALLVCRVLTPVRRTQAAFSGVSIPPIRARNLFAIFYLPGWRKCKGVQLPDVLFMPRIVRLDRAQRRPPKFESALATGLGTHIQLDYRVYRTVPPYEKGDTVQSDCGYLVASLVCHFAFVPNYY
ncbi:hypothetical protein BJV78DRAFT_156165 [Lactifluus subvellereus]|nr:hypothetical protein BJV78DRAFT_156165 [Lactifluus subvellereus]